MTNFEWKNPRFRGNAGTSAFLAGIHIQNNPYQTKYQREQWERGYRAAKRYTESGSTAFYKPSPEVHPHPRSSGPTRQDRAAQPTSQQVSQERQARQKAQAARFERKTHPGQSQNLRPGVHKGVSPARAYEPRPSRSAPPARPTQPAMSSRRIDAFHNKFRTAV